MGNLSILIDFKLCRRRLQSNHLIISLHLILSTSVDGQVNRHLACRTGRSTSTRRLVDWHLQKRSLCNVEMLMMMVHVKNTLHSSSYSALFDAIHPFHGHHHHHQHIAFDGLALCMQLVFAWWMDLLSNATLFFSFRNFAKLSSRLQRALELALQAFWTVS